VAEHVQSLASTEQQQQLLVGLMTAKDGKPAMFKHLCTAVGSALQQYMQQYMQQGQLPAALTVHVVDSISALCYVLNCVYSHSNALPPALQLEQRQQRSPVQRESGESHYTALLC
jgi:hypothetical protein